MVSIKSSTKAYLAMSLQALIVGISFMMVKITLQSTDLFGELAHRFTVAALAAVLFRLLRNNGVPIRLKDWVKVIPLLIINPICLFFFQTMGLTIASSSETGIITALTPFMTLLFAMIFLGEQITTAQKLLMGLSIGGVLYINIMNGITFGAQSLLGFVMLLLSVSSFAGYAVLTKTLTRTYPVFNLVYMMSITGCIVFNLFSITQHAVEGRLSSYFTPFLTPSFLLATLYLGVLASLLTTILSAFALSKIEACRVGLFNNVATIVSILAGTLLLKEPFYYYHYIGITAVLVGAVIFSLIRCPVPKPIETKAQRS